MRPEFTKKPEFMRLAAEQKRTDLPMLLELLRFFLVLVAGIVAQSILTSIPESIWLARSGQLSALMQGVSDGQSMDELLEGLLENMPAWLIAVVGMTGIALGAAAIVYCAVFEKRRIATMGLVRRGLLLHSLAGAAVGAALCGATVWLGSAFGGVRIGALLFDRSMLPLLLLFFLSSLLQAVGEGLLLHGYLAVSLSKRQRLTTCVVISSLVFAGIHQNGLGQRWLVYLNLFLFGVTLGLLMLKTGSLWGVIWMRTAWSFLFTNVFVFTKDGTAEYAVFGGEVTGHNDLLTGGGAGLEGSLCATMALLAAIGVLVWLLTQNPPEEDEPQQTPPETL